MRGDSGCRYADLAFRACKLERVLDSWGATTQFQYPASFFQLLKGYFWPSIDTCRLAQPDHSSTQSVIARELAVYDEHEKGVIRSEGGPLKY